MLLLSSEAPLRAQKISVLRCDKYEGNSPNSRYTGHNRTLTRQQKCIHRADDDIQSTGPPKG